MFGSLGWGLAMFFVGIALDYSTAFPDHPCKPDQREKNYTICFAIFSVLMGAALITATQINFKYDFAPAESVSSVIRYDINTRRRPMNPLAFFFQNPSTFHVRRRRRKLRPNQRGKSNFKVNCLSSSIYLDFRTPRLRWILNLSLPKERSVQFHYETSFLFQHR